jgi:hypothetical protein
MTYNPWQEQHAEREVAFQDNSHTARAVVDNEYRDAPKEVPCLTPGCAGLAFYKATIGAMKCTRCGALYHTNGDPI